MAVMRTLITDKEVVEYGPESTTLPTRVVKQLIRVHEVNFARKWLGWNFYLDLITDSRDLASIAEWKETELYQVGDIVQCYNQLYQSSTANNSGNTPYSDSTNWTEISKMQTQDYIELYEMFLRPYLAFLITAYAVEYAHPVSSKGLTEINQEGEKTASIERSTKRQYATLANAESLLENMAYWIMQKKYGSDQSTSFDKALIIANCALVRKPKGRNRRIAMRTTANYDYEFEYYRSQIGDVEYTINNYEQVYTAVSSNILTWTQNDGELSSLFTLGNVTIVRNGTTILTKDTDYQVINNSSGNDQVVIDAGVYVAGDNYVITAIKLTQ